MRCGDAESAAAHVTVSFDVPAEMRDGVTLRANVYRPAEGGTWPTLLMRSPYGKDTHLDSLTWLDPIRTARSGFVVVVQDVRGRFASDGEWKPFRFEAHDGFDSVEWAARLPGSNGRVGMYCASYLGNTQWSAAMEQPPSLAAIAPSLTWSDPLDGLFERGGALEWGLTVHWDLGTSADHLTKTAMPADERSRLLATLLDDIDGLPSHGYWELPVTESRVVRRSGGPDIGTLTMQGAPEIAAWCRVTGRHHLVQVPSLHIGGWYDLFLQGTLDNHVAMTHSGRPSNLVVGPWTHSSPFADPIGQKGFGVRATRLGVAAHPQGDLNDMQRAWFHEQLSDESRDPREVRPTKPVRIFVMGLNQWRDEAQWPLPRAVNETWFLHAGGHLSQCAPAAAEPPATFVFDPDDPVPTHGGAILMHPDYPAGPLEQTRIEERHDVVIFTSDPTSEDLEVTGRLRVVLHAVSSAVSTDWVARLCDVDHQGRSFNVSDGIRRLDAGADKWDRVEIDLWSTSIVFLAGHRLRIQITSSNFPRWDRNLNTGKQDEPAYVIAKQQVGLDSERASWIELPVVKR